MARPRRRLYVVERRGKERKGEERRGKERKGEEEETGKGRERGECVRIFMCLCLCPCLSRRQRSEGVRCNNLVSSQSSSSSFSSSSSSSPPFPHTRLLLRLLLLFLLMWGDVIAETHERQHADQPQFKLRNAKERLCARATIGIRNATRAWHANKQRSGCLRMGSAGSNARL